MHKENLMKSSTRRNIRGLTMPFAITLLVTLAVIKRDGSLPKIDYGKLRGLQRTTDS
jgi:hypothetical protein